MVLEVSTTLLLAAYALPVVLGLALILPWTSPLFLGMSEKLPVLENTP